MPPGSELAGALLQLATAGVAIYGAVRCIRLQRFAGDKRLKALAAFFALFATALVLQAAWQVGVGTGPPELGFGAHHGSASNATFGGTGAFNGTTAPRLPDRDGHDLFSPVGDEGANILLALSHTAMLASLVVAVWAFGHRRPRDSASSEASPPSPPSTLLAFAPFLVVGTLVPLMLALEAGLTLYLAACALVNHVERKSSGALQVAIGFLLFFAAHLVIYLQHQPGLGRTSLGDVLALVGIVLLVQVLPGKR